MCCCNTNSMVFMLGSTCCFLLLCFYFFFFNNKHLMISLLLTGYFLPCVNTSLLCRLKERTVGRVDKIFQTSFLAKMWRITVQMSS